MKLYLLQPKGYPKDYSDGCNFEQGAWDPWYDKCFGFVIAANSSIEARKIAQDNGGDERNADVWLDASLSNCIELKPENYTKVSIIIADKRSA